MEYGKIKKNLEKIDEFIKKIEAKLNKLEMEIELELIIEESNNGKNEEYRTYNCTYKINNIDMNNEVNNIIKN